MKALFRCMTLLIVIVMLGTTFVACNKKEESQPQNTVAPIVTNEDDGFKVAQTNWDKEFKILAPNWGCYKEFYEFNEESGDTGEPIDMALYTRTERIKAHLGVTLDFVIDGTLEGAFQTMKSTISSGDDVYQLVLTHTYNSLAAVATDGLAYDFKLLKDINIEADYWNKAAMDELEINSAYYYGHSDFILSDPNAVFFNKTMQENYKVRNPYEMVRDGTWTLENMTLESYKVAEPGDKASKNLGFSAIGEWHFMSFLDSCDTKIVIDEGGYKTLNMGADNERYATVYDQIDELCAADSSLIYNSKGDEADRSNNLLSGRVLFTLVPLRLANQYRATEVKFGVLPYPKYDTDQKEYRSFDWSGLMVLPMTIQNPDMVGQVLECLSYFSGHGENDLHTAYYENLLGSKLAESPDDYEMLKIIFGNIVTNSAINMIQGAGSNSTSEGLGALTYSYKHVAYTYTEKGAGNKPDGIAVQWASHKTLAQKALDNTVNS